MDGDHVDEPGETELNPPLDQFPQFLHYCIYFFFCIVFAERKAYRYQVGIIIDRPDHMTAYVGPAAAGTSTGNADMIDVQVEQDHFGFFGLREGGA
jgi:hypothetical protein